ncbi:MAG TPA: LpxD N-terminal domain-containing protein, partial [Chitinophagaceae bacterium]|nr:LpxD N-terminal domain-containing protein [Chitinophagaceae bacterium]
MQFTAAQISFIINGKVEGNADAVVTSFGKIEEAKQNQLTFFANPKYEDYLYSTRASVLILNENYELKQPIAPTLIRVADAYTAFAQLLSKYQEMAMQQLKGIQQPSYIPSSVEIGKDVFIGAFSYFGDNVKIGNNTKIYPNTFIGDNVQIGDNCVIHPGVKIYFGCI